VRENGKTKIKILPEKEVAVYIKTYEEEVAKIEAEKQQKEKAAHQPK
jgi:hypothetical protein